MRMRKHACHALSYCACVLWKVIPPCTPATRTVLSFLFRAPERWGQGGSMRLSLAVAISHGRVYRRLGLGPESRIHLLRNLLTGLVRHERIEATWARVDEMRGYAEKVRAKSFMAGPSLRPLRLSCVGSR